jgi:Transposase DDE domain group 1
LRNLPLHGFAQNQIWCELVAMASELLAWMQQLALDGPARAWEPKRLRLCLFSAAGRPARGGRRLRLRIAATWPWAACLATAITRPQALTLSRPPPNRHYARKDKPRAYGTPPTRRDSRAVAHATTLKQLPAATPIAHPKITKGRG